MCVETGGDDWEDFFQKLSGKDEEQVDDSEDDEDVIEMDLESPYPKVKPFKEAIKA